MSEEEKPSAGEQFLAGLTNAEKKIVRDIDPKTFRLLLDAANNLIFSKSESGSGIDNLGKYSGTKVDFDEQSEFPYTRNDNDKGFKIVVIPLKNHPQATPEERVELSKAYIKEFDCLIEISKYEILKSFVLSFDGSQMIELLKHYPDKKVSLNDAIEKLKKKATTEKEK